MYRSASPDSQLAWVDRNGKTIDKFGEARHFGAFRIAPDGRRVLIEQLDADGRGDDLWLIDPSRNADDAFTFDPASDVAPVWAPDGKSAAFLSLRNVGDIYVADAANPSNVTQLTQPGVDGREPDVMVAGRKVNLPRSPASEPIGLRHLRLFICGHAS